MHVANVVALWRGEKMPSDFLNHQVKRSIPSAKSGATSRSTTNNQQTHSITEGLDAVTSISLVAVVKAALSSVIAAHYNINEIADTPFKDIGIDSFGMLTLASKLTSERLSVNVGDLYKYPTLTQLVSFLEGGQNRSSSHKASVWERTETSTSTSTVTIPTPLAPLIEASVSSVLTFSSIDEDIAFISRGLSELRHNAKNLGIVERSASNILFTGATGYLGRHLLFDLLTQGLSSSLTPLILIV
jgi:aryl carrier-like protein